jgi:hypothetical protein
MPARLYYIVRPSADQWEVRGGLDGVPSTFVSAQEALQMAKGAARQHWRVRGEPSGVLVEQADCSAREEALYG